MGTERQCRSHPKGDLKERASPKLRGDSGCQGEQGGGRDRTGVHSPGLPPLAEALPCPKGKSKGHRLFEGLGVAPCRADTRDTPPPQSTTTRSSRHSGFWKLSPRTIPAGSQEAEPSSHLLRCSLEVGAFIQEGQTAQSGRAPRGWVWPSHLSSKLQAPE